MMRLRSYINIGSGLVAFLVALIGTVLLENDLTRPWGVSLLVLGAGLSVMTWGRQEWPTAFARPIIAPSTRSRRDRILYWLGLVAACFFTLAAGLRYLAAPNVCFGLAGALWLLGMGTLILSVFVGSKRIPYQPERSPWAGWELSLLIGILVLASVTRVWNLTDFPENIYPDEIMTGTLATQAYLNPSSPSPSVFSTIWHDIELPAFWFWMVSLFLKAGGSTLSMLRLPAALFGAATVVPFYLLVREFWGRSAAIAGTFIMAVSASNIHYSRLALNNIVPQFFWITCFLFLLRGLRSKRPIDWTLAGLSAGLSEYFYYATRLLPFILIGFVGYIAVIHRKEVRSYLSCFFLLVCGYFVGFGPLLFHFIRKPELYFGRGTSLLLWSPHLSDPSGNLQKASGTVWTVISQNLLGITTSSSQDIIYFAPLLQSAEGALLVLGTALLLWHWRHPAAFLILISGLGVLLIGGMLVANPGSVPPLFNHWSPVFPLFYLGLSLPIGAWITSGRLALPVQGRWIQTAILSIGLTVIGWRNLNFYFSRYYANFEMLKSNSYRTAQQYYEIQNAQSRFQASLGPQYRVFTVGQSSAPYDPTTTRYLTGEQEWTILTNPAAELSSIPRSNKGIAFLFFPGNEQYRTVTRELYPGGVDREVTSRAGKHLFYAYIVGGGQS